MFIRKHYRYRLIIFIALVANPNLSDDELMEIIPAPDFPTGGYIMGKAGAKKLYLTGHGSISLRCVQTF